MSKGKMMEAKNYTDETQRLETIQQVKDAMRFLSEFVRSGAKKADFPELGSGFFIFTDNCIAEMSSDEIIDNPETSTCVNVMGFCNKIVKESLLDYTLKEMKKRYDACQVSDLTDGVILDIASFLEANKKGVNKK